MHSFRSWPAPRRFRGTAICTAVFAGLFFGGVLGGELLTRAWAQTKSEGTKSLRVGKLSPGMVSLAGIPVIQQELGVATEPTPNQDLSQGELLERLAAAMSEDFQTELQTELNNQKTETGDTDPAERRRLSTRVERLRTQLNTAYLPRLKEVLTESQISRLREIHWQLMGPMALQEPELIEVLKLSNQQINRIRTTISEAQTRISEAANTPFAGGGIERGGYGEMQRRIANVEADRDRQLNDLLTREQRDAWADAVGKPFDRRKLTTAVAAPTQTERSKPKTRSPTKQSAETPKEGEGATLGDRPNSAKKPTGK